MGEIIEIGTRLKMITDRYGEEKKGDIGVVKKFIYEDGYKVIVTEFENYVFEFLDGDLGYSFEIVSGSALTESDIHVGMKVKNVFGEIGAITSVYNGNVRVVYERNVAGKTTRKVSNYRFTSHGKSWFIQEEKRHVVKLSEKDIDDLIDLALDNKDEKWFNELVQRKEALIDATK